METKKYSSYSEIELDLKILKIERKLYYQKMIQSIDNTKESILPSKAITLVGNLYDTVFSGTYGTIIKTIIPIVVNWYLKKKRGN